MTIDREIPQQFVEERRRLTWREVELGLMERWLRREDAVSIAVARVVQGDEQPDVIALAGVLKDDESDVPELVSVLAGRCPGNSESEARLSWMRLLVAWAYQNHARLADPLGTVERIYADFGYPDEIRHLVRYNPPEEGDGSPARGEDALVQKWAEYVDAT